MRTELERRRSDLATAGNAEDEVVDRLCGEILAKELELGYLRGLLDALDDRFAAHWATG